MKFKISVALLLLVVIVFVTNNKSDHERLEITADITVQDYQPTASDPISVQIDDGTFGVDGSIDNTNSFYSYEVPIELQNKQARYEMSPNSIHDEITSWEVPKPKKRNTVKNLPVSQVVGGFSADQSFSSSEVRSTQSTIEAGNFDTNGTLTGSLFIPADPHGAAGPSHLVNVFNTSIQFFQKNGTLDFQNSLALFFAPLSPANATFDPKVIYDQYLDRWVVVTLERTDAPEGSRLLVAVSDDSNPNGTWFQGAVNTLEVILGNNHWLDYPGLAVDDEAIYVTGNMFSFPGVYGGNRVVIIDKGFNSGGLYDGGGTTANIFNPVAGGGFSNTHQPAHMFGTGPTNVGTWLVMYSGLSNGTEAFQAIRVDTPLTAPTFTPQTFFVADFDNTGAGVPDAPQSGGATPIDSGDRRTLNAVWRNNSMYVATESVPGNGPDTGQATVFWAQVNTTNLNALSTTMFGYVGGEDIQAGMYTSYGSIAVNDDDGLVIGFSASSPGIFPSAYFVNRSPTDPAGTVRSSKLIRTGLSSYVRTFGGSNRWGDYSSAALDPDGECFWVYNKYASTNGTPTNPGPETGRWATAYAHFCNDAPVANPDATTVNEGGTVTLLNGNVPSVLNDDTDADNEDTLTAILNAAPADASSFTLNLDGTFSYTHNGDEVPTDSFTYNACDDGSPVKCSLATVNITINPIDDDPTAVTDTATVTENDSATAIDVLDNDTDPDAGPINIASVTQPTNGTVVITNAGADLTYEPDNNYCNDGTPTDDFTYTLNGGSSTTVAVTVTCVDQPPVAVTDTATVAEDSGATSIDVQDNDTDVDGGTNTVNSVTQPGNGTVVITNAGADLTYEPDNNYCNDGTPTDDFTYTLNGGSSATVAVTVTCVDDDPTAVTDVASVGEDSGASTLDVQDNDTDVDGGTNTINSVTQPGNGTVVITNAGADLSYEPDNNYCNDGTPTDDFTYTLNGGSTATVVVTVTCVDDDPTAVGDPASVGEDSGANTINVLGNDTDVDGGTNTVNSVTQPGNGTVVITNAGADLTYEPDNNYCNDGTPTDDFTYTLNGGSSATVAVTVTCVDDDPTAVTDVASVGEDSGASTLDVQDNDTDVDGGTNTINSVTQPGNGTVVITNAGADLTYQPNLNYCNDGTPTDDFTYTLNGGSTATVVVTVTCVDDDPTAVGDPASVGEDSGANTINVLGNDTDPDGGTLNVTGVTDPANGSTSFTAGNVSYTPDADYCNDGVTTDDFTYTINGGSSATVAVTVTCVDDDPTAVGDPASVGEDSGASTLDVQDNDTDVDGGTNTINSVTQPGNGTVVITNAGADLTYQPNLNYCNDGTPTDDFTYTLNGGSTATVAVTVTCVDDDPTAVGDPASVGEDSGANTINVLGNDTDPDGGTLNVTGVTDPANGSTSFTAGNVSYTPDADYCNDGVTTDDFTYTINGGSSATVAVTVTCVDDDPTAVGDPASVGEDSGANTINVLGNDTDPDGGTLNVIGVTDPANGSTSFTAGNVSYTPNANYCNDGVTTDDFTYTINGGSSATVAVTVTCVDDDPTAVGDPASVGEDSGANTINVLGNDTDPDGGTLNVTGVTDPANGSTSFTAGNVSYTPDANYCNDGVTTDDFTYTINGGSSATVAVTVNCVNDEPSMEVNEAVYVSLADIASPPPQSLACLFDFGPADEDATQAVADMLVSIQNDPDGVLSTIDVDNTGSLSYTFTGNSGVAEVTVALQDDGGVDDGGDDTSVAYTFMVNVQDYIFRSDFDGNVCQ